MVDKIIKNEFRKIAFGLIIGVCILFFLLLTRAVGIGNMVLKLFVIFSSISIIVKLLLLLRAKLKERSYSLVNFIRPLTFIAIALPGIALSNQTRSSAEAYLHEIAEDMQSQCIELQKCPEGPTGWEKRYDTRYLYEHFENRVKFLMYYHSNGDHFNIYINYGLDLEYNLNGGVNTKLSKGKYIEP